MRDLRALAQAGGAPTPGLVPPGPAPGTPPVVPPPGSGAGPQPQNIPGGPQAQLIPAPNSQGGLTPEQAQVIQIAVSDPVIMETLLNLLQSASRQGAQQQLFG